MAIPNPLQLDKNAALVGQDIADGTFAGLGATSATAAQLANQDTALFAGSTLREYLIDGFALPSGQFAYLIVNMVEGASPYPAAPVKIISAHLFGSTPGAFAAAGARTYCLTFGAGALMLVLSLIRSGYKLVPFAGPGIVGTSLDRPAAPSLTAFAAGTTTNFSRETRTMNGVTAGFSRPTF